MNYKKLTKKELIERLELLGNAEIGVQVIHDANAIMITPDPKIKNMVCSVHNQQLSNINNLLFQVKINIVD